MGVRVTAAAIAAALIIAAPAMAQEVSSPVSTAVSVGDCKDGPVDRCSLPSGRFLTVKGGTTSVDGVPVGAGTRVRLVAADSAAVEGTTDDQGRWSLRFQPRETGAVYGAQVLVGDAWVNVPGFQAEVVVYAQFAYVHLTSAPGFPVVARGRVNWVERDGAGRVQLRRCAHVAQRRCTDPSDFDTVIASKRVTRPGGGRFELSTRSPLAHGRPLAVVYRPRHSALILGDFQPFAAVP